MNKKIIFFDLDGTLLPMNQDYFLKLYFSSISKRLCFSGYEPEKLIKTIMLGTKSMILNDGKDTNENELKPQQIEVNSAKAGAAFKDSMGYVIEPFEFYFEKGSQKIRLEFIKDYFVIDTLEVRQVEKADSYSEYYNALVAKYGDPANSAKNVYTRIEAEASATKSSPTLYPVTDRSDSATYPFMISLYFSF